MSELRTVMVGAGGHGRVVADLIRLSGHLELVAVVDDDSRTHGGYLDGVEIIGSTALLERHPRAATACVVAIGDNRTRARIYNLALGLGYHLPPLVHPAAVIARGVKLPSGLIVCAGAVVAPGVHLGTDCLIGANATLEADCELGDHCRVGPGALLLYGCRVSFYANVEPGIIVEYGLMFPNDTEKG
jgi:UDP-perosamine 4-acetyltransferase